MSGHTEEVLELAGSVIIALEQGRPVSLVALQARRLAQLIEDDAAFAWLRLECGGIAGQASPDREWLDAAAGNRGIAKFMKLRGTPDYREVTLGSLAETVRRGEALKNTQVLSIPLSVLEAQVETKSEEDSIEALEREKAYDDAAVLRLMQSERRAILGRVAAAIHEWASHVYVTYRFRRTAGNIFDRFKSTTDTVLGRICPDSIEKLNHAIERASSANAEDWADAALACRRVLKAFADSVYPAQAEEVGGRKVGEAEYKNRLWAFAKAQGRAALDSEFLAEEEIDGLCRGLEKMYELESKGVHDHVTREEAQQAILRTYILLSQLAALVADVEG